MPSPATYPFAAGNVFAYGGTLARAYQTFPEIVASGSSPEPVATTLVAVTQTVTVRANQTFNGVSGLTDLHSAESDARTTGLATTTSTTDTYVALGASGAGAQLLDYGSQYADESGDTVSTLLQPATIVDELPEVAGARWTNGAGATYDEALGGDTNGSAITVERTVNGDGTYGEKTTYPPNYSGIGLTGVGQVQEHADGSGSFVIAADGGYFTIAYSPPEPQASGPALITIDEYNGTDTTATPTATFQIPTWYGTTPTLYAESDRDQGVVAIPAGCGLAAGFPTRAQALAQNVTRTDTILGYVETQQTTSYVAPGYGLVCAIMSDTQTLYYDFNGDVAFAFTKQTPLVIATAAETVALRSSSAIAAGTSAGNRAVRFVPQATRVVVGALRARFDRGVFAARAHRSIAAFRAARSARWRSLAHARGGSR